MNGDGVLDMVVGAYGDDDGGSEAGAVYILFLATSGTVLSHQKVSATHGVFTGTLASYDWFGISSGGIGGDLNGDGVLDVVAGAYGDDDGEFAAGAVYIIFGMLFIQFIYIFSYSYSNSNTSLFDCLISSSEAGLIE